MIRLKRKIFRYLGIKGKNVEFLNDAHVGPFSRIWAPNHLSIGTEFYCGKYVTIECDGQIGNFVLIANNVGIVGRRDHEYNQVGLPISRAKWVGKDKDLSSEVTVGDDVWIGFGSIILAPVKIGNCSIIAAGSVVRNDVPEFAIVAGNPAEIVAWRFSGEDTRRQHINELQKYLKNYV